MQDEVREKSVAFVIRVSKTGGKLTASMLKYAIEQYFEQQRNPRAPHGKQSVKSLVRQGAGVQNIEITDKNIRSFQSVARKYGVDYALKKDTSSQPPRYLRRVSAASHRAVEVDAVGQDVERVDTLAEHDGLVSIFQLTPPSFSASPTCGRDCRG